MTKEQILKYVKDEMKECKKDLKRSGWDNFSAIESVEIEDLSPDDSFIRGYYRAMEFVKTMLTEKTCKN